MTDQNEDPNTGHAETKTGGLNGYVNPTMEQTSFETTTVPMDDVLNQNNFIGKHH